MGVQDERLPRDRKIDIGTPRSTPSSINKVAATVTFFAEFSPISGVSVPRQPRDRISWTILRGRFPKKGPFRAPKAPFPLKKSRNCDALLSFGASVGGFEAHTCAELAIPIGCTIPVDLKLRLWVGSGGPL